MLFKVTEQYERGAEITIASFKSAQNAKIFIMAKLAEDEQNRVKVTYRLLEGIDVIEEFVPGQAGQVSQTQATSQGSGSGQGQRSSFQPTPFNAAPRPSGMPPNWLKDQDKDKDDKK